MRQAKRGNSGVSIRGKRYEIQVLDSYGAKVKQKDDCGAIYSIAAPVENVCKAPTIWQSYDIEYTAPKCEGGKKTVPAGGDRLSQRRGGKSTTTCRSPPTS